MSIFKKFSYVFLGGIMFFAVSQDAKAVPGDATITFTSTIESTFTPLLTGASIGEEFTITIIANNGSDATAGATWGAGDIVGDVIGSLASGYSVNYGPTDRLFTLTMNAAGDAVDTAFFDDLGSADNDDGSTGALFDSVNFPTVFVLASDSSNAILAHLSDDPLRWTVSVESGDTGNGNGGSEVPEPGALAVFGVGLIGFAALRRRKRYTF